MPSDQSSLTPLVCIGFHWFVIAKTIASDPSRLVSSPQPLILTQGLASLSMKLLGKQSARAFAMNLVMVCLLLCAQTIVVVHATEHVTHEHTEFCDLAETAAQHDTQEATQQHFLPAQISRTPLSDLECTSRVSSTPSHTDIRAPPFS